VDPSTGKKVPQGAVGEIVATCFNLSYPMIRMATGDLSCVSEQTCACGRTGLLLKKIIGRLDQATKVKGVFIHPWQTDEVMSRYPEVIKYQIVVSRKNHLDRMTVVAEVKEGLSETASLQRTMERELEDLLGVRTSVQMVSRGTLPDRHRKIEDQRKWD
jgi:phenylacetate-CoA ligase